LVQEFVSLARGGHHLHRADSPRLVVPVKRDFLVLFFKGIIVIALSHITCLWWYNWHTNTFLSLFTFPIRVSMLTSSCIFPSALDNVWLSGGTIALRLRDAMMMINCSRGIYHFNLFTFCLFRSVLHFFCYDRIIGEEYIWVQFIKWFICFFAPKKGKTTNFQNSVTCDLLTANISQCFLVPIKFFRLT
jgi:hypothetical protein